MAIGTANDTRWDERLADESPRCSEWLDRPRRPTTEMTLIDTPPLRFSKDLVVGARCFFHREVVQLSFGRYFQNKQQKFREAIGLVEHVPFGYQFATHMEISGGERLDASNVYFISVLETYAAVLGWPTVRGIVEGAAEVDESAQQSDAEVSVDDIWLEKAKFFEQYGRHRKALDVVYRSVDGLLCEGQFERVDTLLGRVEVHKLTLHLMLALLTITAAAKDQLPSRANYYLRVKAELQSRDQFEDSLLIGLD